MGTLLDLLLLLVIGKEALELGADLPQMLWAAFVIGLPFLLGMGHSMRENHSSIIREPVQTLIGEGITFVTFILFLILLTYQGLAAVFWSLFLIMLIPYGLGRMLGMTAKGLLLIGIIVLSMFFFGRFFDGTL